MIEGFSYHYWRVGQRQAVQFKFSLIGQDLDIGLTRLDPAFISVFCSLLNRALLWVTISTATWRADGNLIALSEPNPIEFTGRGFVAVFAGCDKVRRRFAPDQNAAVLPFAAAANTPWRDFLPVGHERHFHVVRKTCQHFVHSQTATVFSITAAPWDQTQGLEAPGKPRFENFNGVHTRVSVDAVRCIVAVGNRPSAPSCTREVIANRIVSGSLVCSPKQEI